jgi:hypothetical protein
MTMKPLSIVKGVDCFSTIRPEWAPQLRALGYSFACRYYRRAPLTGGRGNAVSREEVAALHANGMGFLPVYQNTSDKPEYFDRMNGWNDAAAAIAKAEDMGQPKGTAIYFAVDCDPDVPPLGYFQELNEHVRDWDVSVYGPGHVCKALKVAGLAKHTWLANAKGWRGYKEWLPHADVVQTTLPFTLPFGLEVDGNECRNERCLWMPKVAKHEPYDPPESWLTRFMRLLMGQRS